MTLLPHRLPLAGAIGALALLAIVSTGSNAQGTSTAAPTTTIGTAVDDSVITAKVMAALMSNDDIKSIDIKVKSYKGEVMLSGFADNQVQIDRSIAVAKGVEGVTKIDNQLSLKEGRQSIGNTIDDTVVTARVKAALLAEQSLNSLDVSVTTRKGEVQLSGFVANQDQSTHAMNVAKGVEGVGSVVNHMSIKQ
jgi:hyperosmotically inducible protein